MGIKLITLGTSEQSSECIVCFTSLASASSSVTVDKYGDLAGYEYILCPNCNSYSLSEPEKIIGYVEMSESSFWHYAQIGAGLGFMADLLNPAISQLNKTTSMLDVGCGAGFMLDYARFAGVQQVVGIEDADYGRVGSQMLGLNIRGQKDAPDKQFEIVTASEVIEHVDNPRQFIDSIKKFLDKNGVLILTTPDAGYINSENISENQSVTYAALSPGFHTCLLSKSALETLLVDSGFVYVKVIVREERLIAFASDSPLPDELQLNSGEKYLGYLSFLTTNSDPHISSGAAFRLFKELVNQGATDSVVLELEEILDKWIEDFKLIVPSRGLKDADDLDNFLTGRPIWLGSYLLYKAQLSRNLNFPGKQIYLLEKSIFEIGKEIAEAPRFSMESFANQPVAFNRLSEALDFMRMRYFPQTIIVDTNQAPDDIQDIDQQSKNSLELEISQLYASKSWKITEPLRAIRRAIDKLFLRS